MSKARLILTCGLPGAGKTTLAKEVAAERGAVRLTKDEWQWALGSSPWDRNIGEKIEGELWRLAQEILTLGLSVERADLDEWMNVFHPPDADELALYDPPPAEGADRRR